MNQDLLQKMFSLALHVFDMEILLFCAFLLTFTQTDICECTFVRWRLNLLMSVLVSDFVVSMQKMYCEVLNLIVRKLFNTFSTILFLSFSDETIPYFILIIKFMIDCSFSSTFLVLIKHDSACKGLFLYKIMLLVKNNIIALNAYLCLRDSYQ